ncbi:hypothetical protein [Erwinia amylovora]|uniref:hypothetical protein n=2 Tax=Erwinia amylovora TaxID=552 RepID=UPI0012BB537F|nr:hypothetical protein [Erwinia amylovora]
MCAQTVIRGLGAKRKPDSFSTANMHPERCDFRSTLLNFAKCTLLMLIIPDNGGQHDDAVAHSAMKRFSKFIKGEAFYFGGIFKV